MSAKVSKWRQTTAKLAKSDTHLLNVVPTGAIWDGSSLMASSGKWLAVPWKTIGGVAIFKGDASGKLGANPPMIHGHQGQVIDVAFSQFDEDLLFTGGEDCVVKGWKIPDGGLTPENEKGIEPAFTLTGHGKKVGLLTPHHAAAGVLATGSTDNHIKIWDIETQKANVSFQEVSDQMGSLNFNLDGSLLCTTTKDKKLWILDSRSGNQVANAAAHKGSKSQKSVWAKNRGLIVTCGFTQQQYREIKVWDVRNLGAAAATLEIDQQTGVMLPFMDDDLNMLYVGGKGDGGIKYFDLWEDATPITALNAYNNTEAAKGLCNVPKRHLNTRECEVQRFYKMTTKSIVQVSFTVPRKTAAVEFQEDVYPPTFSSEPAISSEEFFSGKNSNPKTSDMKALFDGKPLESAAPKEAAADSAPAPKKPEEEPKKAEEPKKEEPKKEDPKPVEPAPVKEEPKKTAEVPKKVAEPKKAEEPVPAPDNGKAIAIASQEAIVLYLEAQLAAEKKKLTDAKAAAANKKPAPKAKTACKFADSSDSDSDV